jgi:hypothetical protein
MLDGIKLLIERMDQCPEEFFGDLSFRWADIMQDISKHGPEFLEQEDILLLSNKVKEVRRKELNAKIVEEIASGARLQVARERQVKANIYATQGSTALKGASYAAQGGAFGSAIARSEGNQVWWSGAVPGVSSADYQGVVGSADYQGVIDKTVHDMIERGQDNATIQNIRAQNAMLEEQLKAAEYEIAQRDAFRARSQAYKKRSNQNWK